MLSVLFYILILNFVLVLLLLNEGYNTILLIINKFLKQIILILNKVTYIDINWVILLLK